VRVLDGRWLHVLQAHVLHTDVVLCYMRATLESGAGGQALQCSRAHWSPAGCKGGLVWSCHETPPSWGLRFVGTTDTDAPGSSASGDGGRLAPLIAESARPLSGFSLAHWPESFRPQGTRSEPVDASTRINETTRLCLATGKAQVTWYYIHYSTQEWSLLRAPRRPCLPQAFPSALAGLGLAWRRLETAPWLPAPQNLAVFSLPNRNSRGTGKRQQAKQKPVNTISRKLSGSCTTCVLSPAHHRFTTHHYH
jgi:hypothetical protein